MFGNIKRLVDENDKLKQRINDIEKCLRILGIHVEEVNNFDDNPFYLLKAQINSIKNDLNPVKDMGIMFKLLLEYFNLKVVPIPAEPAKIKIIKTKGGKK